MSCAICYDDTVEPVGLTECNHEYHQSCFNRWVAARHGVQVTCCMCRRVVVNHRLTIRLTPEQLIEQQRQQQLIEQRQLIEQQQQRQLIEQLMQEHRMFMERRANEQLIHEMRHHNEHPVVYANNDRPWYTRSRLHRE